MSVLAAASEPVKRSEIVVTSNYVDEGMNWSYVLSWINSTRAEVMMNNQGNKNHSIILDFRWGWKRCWIACGTDSSGKLGCTPDESFSMGRYCELWWTCLRHLLETTTPTWFLRAQFDKRYVDKGWRLGSSWAIHLHGKMRVSVWLRKK